MRNRTRLVLALTLAAPIAHASVWSPSEQGCYDQGYNTATQATGGEHEGMWLCTNTGTAPGDPTIDDDLFTVDVLADLNAHINAVPDFDTDDVDLGGHTYLLESTDTAAGRTITVSSEGITAGAFADHPIPGAAETADIGIDGSGDPSGGRYHLYAGIITSGPWCTRDVDGDADTDVFDFAILASLFGEAVSPGATPDFDTDGLITVFDFAEFVANFGCDPSD